MGRHMAANLVKSGTRVTVSSVSGKKHAELEAKGARATSDHRETLLGARGIAHFAGKQRGRRRHRRGGHGGDGLPGEAV